MPFLLSTRKFVFVCWDIFRSSSSEELWKVTLFIRSGIFKGISDEVPIVKELSVPFVLKALRFYGKKFE